MEKITKERVLEELACIGFANVNDYLRVEDGGVTVCDSSEVPRELAGAVAAVEKAAGGIKLKFYDKLKALELLGKYLCLFDQQASTEQTGLLERLVGAVNEEVQDSGDAQSQAKADAELVE